MEQETYHSIPQQDFEEYFNNQTETNNDNIEVPLNSFVDHDKTTHYPNGAEYSSLFSTKSNLAEPRVEYIRNSFKGFPQEMYKEFLGLYAEFFQVQMRSGKKNLPIKAEQNKKNTIMLYFFEKENEAYFLAMHPSKFCSSVRDIIMEFEAAEMEYQEPRIRKNRWRDCHEELFCLKYFCINAAKIKNDIYLSYFIHELKDLSETVIDLNYNKLRNQLKALVDLRRRGGCDPTFDNMNPDKALIIKREQLEYDNHKLEIENQLIKKDLDGFTKVVTRGLQESLQKNYKEEITQLEARLEAKFAPQQNNHICQIL